MGEQRLLRRGTDSGGTAGAPLSPRAPACPSASGRPRGRAAAVAWETAASASAAPESPDSVTVSLGDSYFFGLATWLVGPQLPDQGSHPKPPQGEHGVLTTGPPGNSLTGTSSGDLRVCAPGLAWSSVQLLFTKHLLCAAHLTCIIPCYKTVVSDPLRPHGLQHTGLPVHYQLAESTQTQVHRVGDAIQRLVFCSPLLLPPPTPPSIRVLSVLV